MQLYSYHFITNSKSYLMLLVFEMVFSVPVKSQIEPIGGERGVGWVGWSGVGGGPKAA